MKPNSKTIDLVKTFAINMPDNIDNILTDFDTRMGESLRLINDQAITNTAFVGFVLGMCNIMDMNSNFNRNYKAFHTQNPGR